MRFTLGAAAAALILAAAPAAQAAPTQGTFSSSDPLLNTVWTESVNSARDMISPPVSLDPRGCPIPASVKTILLDGVVRDRCPYIGDEAVIDSTLLVSSADAAVETSMLRLFASLQHADGAIPASPLDGGSVVLVDYSAYFVVTLHDVVLRTGQLALGRRLWPAVTGVLDRWYPAQLEGGLVANRLGHAADYAYIRRQSPTAAYYSAVYAYALEEGAELAGWLGKPQAAIWRLRAAALDARIASTFWDGNAFTDAPLSVSPRIHPEDANALATLAGAGTPAQQVAALTWDARVLWLDYGNGLVDSNVWDNPEWGVDGDKRVYPFIGYFDGLSRFRHGLDTSALDLIRREWGYMTKHGPGTTWETIGPYGGPPVDIHPSYDSGWSSGAAPLLTDYALGVRPTSPGYRTFDVQPHGGDLLWAQGVVPTPHGAIKVGWRGEAAGLRVEITAPPGTVARVTNGTKNVLVRGHRVVVLPSVS
jgi:hypothetical protein